MMRYTIRFLPEDVSVSVEAGTSLLEAAILAGLHPDAPCGGKGSCGKCTVKLENGERVRSCQTPVTGDITVFTAGKQEEEILTEAAGTGIASDGENEYCLAFDVGTTTVVGYLLEGKTGKQLAQRGTANPQRQYGADVISRIQFVLDGGGKEMQEGILGCLRSLTSDLAEEAGVPLEKITASAIVGNTAMHHLLLGIDPRPLITPPYMPLVREAMEVEGLLPIPGTVRMLPNIAGFVGGDTVGCMAAVSFDSLTELTLLIDIGTNGEMVLGDAERRIACSTAAGPAFEGAKISCGMRGEVGAVDHVQLTEEGELRFHVIGDGAAKGLCGSGLLDLIAALLEKGDLEESGLLEGGSYTLCQGVVLTQKDVREVQLAKAAIRAGIELLTARLGRKVTDIQQVLLAGAFGNYLTPASACRIGLIPPELEGKIRPIGNAAGAGAIRCALSRREFDHSKLLAGETEFLELAGLPEFQDRYVDALFFSEELL